MASKSQPKMTLTWKGNSFKKTVREAAASAINETMGAAVNEAQMNAPVDTGALKADISYQEASSSSREIVGYWGNFLSEYAIYQELGTRYIPAKRYLRNAADSQYSQIGDRMRRFFNGI